MPEVEGGEPGYQVERDEEPEGEGEIAGVVVGIEGVLVVGQLELPAEVIAVGGVDGDDAGVEAIAGTDGDDGDFWDGGPTEAEDSRLVVEAEDRGWVSPAE